MGIKIDITPKDLKTVKDLIKQYLPNTLVWAFGSRVKFTAKLNSDLDLVAFISKKQELKFSLLKEALEESSIPFRIDLHNWYELPETFHKNIESSFVVLQEDTKQELPSEWKTYKLGEIAELRKEQIVSNGIEQPYIGLEHIEQQSLRLNGIGSSDSVVSNKFKFYNGDTLYGRLRPYFRKVYNPKFEGVCSTEIFVIKNKKNIDKDFLYYLVATEEFTNIANSGSSGTHMPRADWKQLEKSKWNIPDLATQTAIAQILTSLDDKIELNLQMNQTLEAMAQALFTEWFVDFNFPKSSEPLISNDLSDDADLKTTKEKSGQSFNQVNHSSDKLPKGWRMGVFEELTDIKTGKGLKRTEFKPDGIYPIIGANGELGRTDEYLLDDKLLLTGRVGTLGSIKISYGKKWYSDNVLIMKPYKYFYFSYFNLKAIDMSSLNRGSTQPLVTQTDLKNYLTLIPSNEIVLLFEKTVNEIFEKIFFNDIQIQTLTQTRDALLPKLMSGKIEIN